MANRKQMLEDHRKYLLGRGYPPGIVEKAMSWAVGSAEGMAKYGLDTKDPDADDPMVRSITDKFLPKFLKESEKWIQAFGHEPKNNSPTG